MQLEDYFDFLAPDDIRIKGHRIGIETILYQYIHQRRTAEEIVQDYDLTPEEIYATILYYLHNKEAVGKYLTDYLEYCHESREKAHRENPEFYEKWRRLKAEWAARHEAEQEFS